MPREDEIYLPHVGWLTYEEGDDVLRYLREGWFEFKEQAFLWLYLRENDVVMDCGAHAGLYSALSAAIVRNQGTVIAIEPHPHTVELLRRNLRACGATCAIVVEAALSSSQGTAVFYPGGSTKSAYSSMMPIDEGASAFQVKTTTVDAVCEAQGIERIDFLKVDAEGSELQVLEGASAMIGKGRLPVVMVEFAETNLRRAGLDTRILFEKILSRGYVVARFDQDLCELVPIRYEAPITYDNYFATTNLAMVNQRLREVSTERHRIARELISRGAGKETVIGNLMEQLRESEGDRSARLAVIQKLQRALDESEADRCARLEVIRKLQKDLDESEADRAERLEVIQKLKCGLEESEANRAAHQKEIDFLRQGIEEGKAERRKQANTIEALQAQLASQSAILAKLPIRILRALGIA